VKGVRRPSGVFPSLPSGVDLLLKRHFDSFRSKGRMPPELTGLRAGLFSDRSKLDEWRDYHRGLRFTDSRIGLELKGALDEVLEKGGKLIVLDFKTRGFPIKEDSAHYYEDQLALYSLLLRKNGFSTEDYAYLLFYHPTQINKRGGFEFQADLIKVKLDFKHLHQLLTKAASVLKQNKPPASAKECEYCKWKKRSRLQYS
jgi:hypothetical protein